MGDKNKVAYVKVRLPFDYKKALEDFRRRWHKNDPTEVTVVFRDQVKDFTIEEFVEALGFDLPCPDCDDTKKLEVGQGDDIREVPCINCKVEEEEFDDDSK